MSYFRCDGGGSIVTPTLIDKSVSANGTYNASSDNADGYKKVTVNVQPNLGTKNITANGTYNASSDGKQGYSSVTVSVNSSVAHWSNDNKICVVEEVGTTKWYFVGVEKTTNDLDIPSELSAYVPQHTTSSQIMRSYGYDSSSGSGATTRKIGFVYPGTQNIKIRTWNGDSLASGTFYGVVDLIQDAEQTNPYVSPT